MAEDSIAPDGSLRATIRPPKPTEAQPEPDMTAEDDYDDPVVSGGGTPAETDDYDDPLAGSTATEKIGAFGEQATGGLMESGGVLGGMVMGAKVGALGGPAAPFTVPLGAAFGAYAGYRAGQSGKALAGIPKIEDLPPDQRPYGYAGEVVGASTPFAAAPLAAARAGARLPPSTVGNFINRIIDMAGKAPGTFAASEASAMAASAAAGGIAEAYRPGETGPRIAAEIAGGFFNRTRLVVAASKSGYDALRKAVSSFSPAARVTKAGQILQEVLEAGGEDPQLVMRLLRESGLPGVGPQTGAQRTGSPALAELEAALAKDSARFGADAEKMAKESLGAIQDMLVALRGTGDPAALTAAAQLQTLRFRTLLAGRVQNAEREAAEAAARITNDTPAARAQLSKTATEALDGALRDSRKVESELWGKLRSDIPATASQTVARHTDLRAKMLPEEPMPAVVEGFVKRMEQTGGATTSGELRLFRSRMLKLARQAAGKGDVDDARIFGRMAESALDDLDRMFSGPREGILRTLGQTAEDYTAARTFSRELNETFTRTFAGDALASTSRGGDRIPPELMLRRALGTGKEAGDLRFQELEEATRFLPARGLGGEEAVQNLETVLDAQERILRLAGAEAIDPNTGKVSATRLAKIIRDNEALLNRFPEAKADLEAAVGAQNRLADVDRMAKGISRVADQQAAFSRVGKYENASDAVKAAVAPGNKAPLDSVMDLVKVAKRGGADAIEGLKAAVWEHAAASATNQAGGIDLAKLGSAMFDLIRPGQPSLMDVMVREGVIKAADKTRAQRLFGEAAKIVSVMDARPTAAALEDAPGALIDFVTRVAGARAGAMMSGGKGSSLIAASRGSATMQNIFDKVPTGKIKDLLIEAARDPAFQAMLLEKTKSPSEGLRLMRRIHAYLFAAGLTSLPEQE